VARSQLVIANCPFDLILTTQRERLSLVQGGGFPTAQATRVLTEAVSSASPFFASAKNIEVFGFV
jgi:hypothetical protein